MVVLELRIHWERRFNSPPMCRSETPLLPAGNKWHVSLHHLEAKELTEVNFPSGGHFSPARGKVSPPQRGATFTAVPTHHRPILQRHFPTIAAAVERMAPGRHCELSALGVGRDHPGKRISKTGWMTGAGAVVGRQAGRARAAHSSVSSNMRRARSRPFRAMGGWRIESISCRCRSTPRP